jgi:hypothetical protein
MDSLAIPVRFQSYLMHLQEDNRNERFRAGVHNFGMYCEMVRSNMFYRDLPDSLMYACAFVCQAVSSRRTVREIIVKGLLI